MFLLNATLVVFLKFFILGFNIDSVKLKFKEKGKTIAIENYVTNKM